MKKHPLLLSLLISATIPLSLNPTSAQILTEREATPSILSEAGSNFLITAVNFKNSENDWVKMQYYSPSALPLNMKGMGFADDSVFKTVESDIWIASGQELLLRFNSPETDRIPYLYTSRKGLTATTEQFIIYDNLGDVLDAVCWTSSSPTAGEIEEMAELFENEGWSSPDILSCLPSESVKTDESLLRISSSDTNSAADWIFESAPNTGGDLPTAEYSTAGTETAISPNPEIINLDDNQSGDDTSVTEGQPSKQETAPTIIPSPAIVALDNTSIKTLADSENQTKNDSGKKTAAAGKTANYQNGSLSDDLIISEIMPNPDGTDTGSEWIEICNKGDERINLGNWVLDDIEEGSKPYIIPDNIAISAGEAMLFSGKDTKLSLANKEDSVRLINYSEQLKDKVDYEETFSGMSYSLIEIESQITGETRAEWIWTGEPTPGAPNPVLIELMGTITAAPEFDPRYNFKISSFDEKQQTDLELTIEFTEDVLAAPLAKATFIPGYKIKLLLQKSEDNTFKMKKFEIINETITNEEFFPVFPVLIATGIVLLTGGFYLLQKRIPWQNITESVINSHEKFPSKKQTTADNGSSFCSGPLSGSVAGDADTCAGGNRPPSKSGK